MNLFAATAPLEDERILGGPHNGIFYRLPSELLVPDRLLGLGAERTRCIGTYASPSWERDACQFVTDLAWDLRGAGASVYTFEGAEGRLRFSYFCRTSPLDTLSVGRHGPQNDAHREFLLEYVSESLPGWRTRMRAIADRWA